MFKSFLSYFMGSKDDENLLDEAFAILAKSEETPETESVENEPESEFTCHKTGYITNIDNKEIEIDGKYFANIDEDLKVGTKVSFIVFKDLQDIKISSVKPIDDEWCEEQKEEIKNLWCLRKIVGTVYKREQRNFYVNPGEIKVNLNEAISEFIPMIGDWVELETKSEIDENVTNLSGSILEIVKISPLRVKIVKGSITSFDIKAFVGNINNEFYFDRESLNDDYIPKCKDQVVAEVIESNQLNFNWRATKIILHNQKVDEYSFPMNDNVPIRYENYVEGVNLSESFIISSNKLNEIKTLSIFLKNETGEDLKFLGVKFISSLSQMRLKYKLNAFVLKPGDEYNFDFLVKFKNFGENKELVIFLFQDFNIGRSVYVNLYSNNFNVKQGNFKNNNVHAMMRNHRQCTNDIIRGERIGNSIRFVSVRIGSYKIPEYLWDLYLNFDYCESSAMYHDLIKLKPNLNANLIMKNYEDRFHTLLYLEEIQQMFALRKFDQDRACFIKNGEFLMLEIENLAEKRPSIIIGDKIIATSLENLSISYEGSVHKVTGQHVYLKFTSFMHDSYNGEDFKIHVVASRTQFKRLHHAITCAVRYLTNYVLFPTKVIAKTPQTKFVYDKYDDIILTTNRKLKDRTVTNSKTKELIHEKVPTKLLLKPLNNEKSSKIEIKNSKSPKNSLIDINTNFKLEWYDKSLNYFQKEAVRNILLGEARPLPYIIFGPPGTGKTVTVVESILQILRMIPHSRIVVATPSNSAADLLALRLIDSEVLKPGDLVRLVAYKIVMSDSIPLKLIPYSATCNIAKEGTANVEPVVNKNGLIMGCSASVLGRHRITIGTCSALSNFHVMGFKLGHFTHIFIDEAGQCTEPETMIPLTFLDVKEGQVVLAGDPMQLGPSIQSKQAREFGLEESYLLRILKRFPYMRDIQGFPKTGGYDPRLVTKLLYNYRSLPGMLTVSNKLFYHSELRATVSETDSEEFTFLKQFQELLPVKNNKIPCLVFHGINGTNYQTSDCPSWFNPDEASQIFYYLNEFYRLGAKSTDIAVITPYIKQVKQLRSILKEAEFDIPKIGTVEEFQGQEYNIVLLSTVRSNLDLVNTDVLHFIGFVGSPKRLNVSLTRAKCLTIVVGNPFLLYNESHWRAVITHCIENGAYVGCDVV